MKKGHQYKAKIRKGVAVGSALLLGTSAGESAGADVDVRPSAADLAAIEGGTSIYPSVDFTTSAGTTQLVSVSLQPATVTWKSSNARRFRELVAKRASDEISKDEQAEFESLQQLRRMHHLASPDDIISEWRRRRFVADLL